ncbi:hypothetical protein BZL39_A10070 [Zygosaccharomyces parabailii]|nr:hypothetical protein BZL39_A10070 [Zygosaccharomyces parabailii]
MFWVYAEHPEAKPKWWKEAAIYQIYPASFKDTNGDGWGDLNGITEKLKYLKDLGIDAIWVCPFYDSPQEDMGYDVANYEKVWPTYGSNQDCFRLIDECHNLGMKFITDLVINHCSVDHEWFKESSSSKENPKRDWFIWRTPKGYDNKGKAIPPNNWRSCFGGPAWTYDSNSREFYLRLFAKGQPDFNWENEQCRKAIYNSAVGFWLDHGVDGFRVDVGSLYSKVEGLPDAPITNSEFAWQYAGLYYMNGPRIHEFHQELNKFIKARVKDGREIFTVGEMVRATDKVKRMYTSDSRNELCGLFNFSHVTIGTSNEFRYRLLPYDLKDWKLAITESFRFINKTDSWSTVYFENHDQARSITRFGDDSAKYRVVSGKLLCILEISLTGTIFIYQGQELGQINLKNYPLDKYEDIELEGYYHDIKDKFGDNSKEMSSFKEAAALISRDHARTPMQWNKEESNAGFSDPGVTPWFNLNESYRDGVNVEDETEDPNSVLNFWRKALELRKCYKNLLVYGYDFNFLDLKNPYIFSFTKNFKDELLFVALNFSPQENKLEFPKKGTSFSFLFGNYPVLRLGAFSKVLRPWEGRIYIKN